MATYALMGDTISNAAGNGPPTFPFGMYLPSVTKDIAGSPYTITDTDAVSYVFSSINLSVATAVTLPLAANNIGRKIQFKKTDTGNFALQVALSGADTLDGFTVAYPILSVNGSIIVMAATSGKWVILEATKIAPTMTKLISGTSYNVPPYVTALNVKMVGGGAGGNGGGSAAGTIAGNGGTTTFGTWLSASGGLATGWATAVQPGVSGTITSPAYGSVFVGSIASGTANGTTGGASANGSNGAASPFGGNGAGGGIGSPSTSAAANNGSGGGAGYSGNGANPVGGVGGGAGAYIEATIPASAISSSTISYAIGAFGAGGAGGTGGAGGGNGSAGCILITEIYT